MKEYNQMSDNCSKFLLFIRHGEYSRQPDVFADDFQAGLTPLGRTQAEKTATAALKFDADTVITSDFLRTVETAEIISNHIGINVISDIQFRERAFPTLYGKTRSEVANILPREDFDMMINGNSDNIQLEGAETLLESQQRVKHAVDKVLKQYGQRIIVVSHGGLHGLLCSQVLSRSKLNNRIFPLGLARMSLFKFDSNGIFCSLGFLNSGNIPTNYIK